MDEREDLATLRAMGFEDEELKRLGLWEPAVGDPADLAEMYLRRSKRKDTLSALREQVRQMCGFALTEQKRIRHVWFEQKSASKAHVKREEFDKATGAVLAALSRTLYVYKTSRLSRRGMGHVGTLLDQFDQRHARFVMVVERLDSSKGSRMVLAILSEQAREQAKEIAQWTKLGGDAAKHDGRWPGGTAPYGLTCPKGSGRLLRDEKEYPISRKMIAEPLLDGATPAAVAAELNRLRIPTRKGKVWRVQAVIHLVQSPSYAGLIPNRERKVDEFGNPLDKWYKRCDPLVGANGHPISAGEGVVTYAEWERIRAAIAARSRPGTTIGDRSRGARRPVTFLTHVLRCPRCDGPMGNGGRNYRCLARIERGPAVCAGIATTRDRVDSAMTAMWKNHIVSLAPDSPTIVAIAKRWLTYTDPDKEARKAAVTAALEGAASRELRLNKEYFLGGSLSETEFESLRSALTAQIASLKAELKELSQEIDISPLLDPDLLGALWEGANVEGKRALMGAAVTKVTIMAPKGIGDRTPIEDRLIVEWRDSTDNAIDAAFDAAEHVRTRGTK